MQLYMAKVLMRYAIRYQRCIGQQSGGDGRKAKQYRVNRVKPDLLPVLTYAGLGAETINFVTEKSHVALELSCHVIQA